MVDLGFDPTYKGWKHGLKETDVMGVMRFDPTYKGWKRNLLEDILDCECGFDPTYKGWKRDAWKLYRAFYELL